MRARSINAFRMALPIVLATLVAACGGGGRITVDGYGDQALNRKKVVLLLPGDNDLIMNNSAAYAASRGVATEGAREMLGSELRTALSATLGTLLDSNTVTNYRDEVASGLVALDATELGQGGAPKSWEAFGDAARQGNLDYFVVINQFAISNTTSTTGRGDEKVELSYSLLDPIKRRVMTSGQFSVSVSEPRVVADTYQRMAEELSTRLPFHIRTK